MVISQVASIECKDMERVGGDFEIITFELCTGGSYRTEPQAVAHRESHSISAALNGKFEACNGDNHVEALEDRMVCKRNETMQSAQCN